MTRDAGSLPWRTPWWSWMTAGTGCLNCGCSCFGFVSSWGCGCGCCCRSCGGGCASDGYPGPCYCCVSSWTLMKCTGACESDGRCAGSSRSQSLRWESVWNGAPAASTRCSHCNCLRSCGPCDRCSDCCALRSGPSCWSRSGYVTRLVGCGDAPLSGRTCSASVQSPPRCSAGAAAVSVRTMISCGRSHRPRSHLPRCSRADSGFSSPDWKIACAGKRPQRQVPICVAWHHCTLPKSWSALNFWPGCL